MLIWKILNKAAINGKMWNFLKCYKIESVYAKRQFEPARKVDEDWKK